MNPDAELGKVTTSGILIEQEDWGNISSWKTSYDNAIGDLLKNQESEQALSAI